MSIIKLDNISKSFGNHEIFKNFSLEIKKGDFVCISGDSGKGKTTLLNILGMLDTPDTGNVVINDKTNPKFNSKLGRKILRDEIFYIFQNYGLVEDKTVKYNLEIAASISGKNKEEDYINALEKVGLDSNFLKKKIFTLSGGEQQRCAMARIYLKKFNIVLADEPTGSLDSNNREKVMEILKNINNDGKTIIVVTHDPEVVKCAKTIVKL